MEVITPSQIIDEVIEREGRVYTNDPKDAGGPTKFGITLRTLSKYRGVQCTPEDVQKLEEPEARDIYQGMYLSPWAFMRPSPLQTQLIDITVNSGYSRAVKCLQKALGIKADGIPGPATAAYLAAHPDWRYLSNRVARERILFLSKLISLKSSQLRFINGWMDRATSFLI